MMFKFMQLKVYNCIKIIIYCTGNTPSISLVLYYIHTLLLTLLHGGLIPFFHK